MLTQGAMLYFNCTIQELKLEKFLKNPRPGYNFNCTIQELKRIRYFHVLIALANFNCTIQELKQKKLSFGHKKTAISIAPYRN